MAPKLVHERKLKPSEQKAIVKAAKRVREEGLTEADAPSWDRFGDKLEYLPEIAAEYISLTQTVNEAEKRKKEIRDLVEASLVDLKEEKVRGDFFLAHRYKTHKAEKIQQTLLLEAGVDIDVITACTTGGPDDPDAEYYVTKITMVE